VRRSLIALSALVLLLAACGDDDEPASSGSTTTEAPSTTAAGVDLAEACAPYATVQALFGNGEAIALGNHDGQVAADEQLATAIEELQGATEGQSEDLAAAIETIGTLSFQVTDESGGAPPEEIDAAFATLDEELGAACADTGECPAPETLDALGLDCDSEGTLTPAGDSTDGGGKNENEGGDEGESGGGSDTGECPPPETLEANGLQCDSEGNVTPNEEGMEQECPPPETLEAEGLTCDESGHVYPIADGSDGEGAETPDDGSGDGGVDDGSGGAIECPPPETLEAEGLQCDSEGNVTPIE